LVLPSFYAPEFTLDAFFSISVPVAILVIGAENAQATGVLLTEGYKPPINFMTIISGIGGIMTSFFGGHNANIAGPMTAICASEAAGENKDGRYAATVINGILFAGFGVIASIAVTFIQGVPKPLIGMVAGLAMIGVLTQAFEQAFAKGKFKVGAFFALVIAMSGISVAKISAPFWALVVGVIISLIIEPQDFKSKSTR
ncbi:MAG: benzoate/H(+) symporter BenE family transporter, partial [Desulfobacterales bacterium]|nr:benzoate/H(+) symporter BenE family transporter [Desulfobacterales bacterium]